MVRTLEKKFKVIKNEQEHNQNEVHVLCRYYEHLVRNGVPKKDAKRYVRWYCKYRSEGLE